MKKILVIFALIAQSLSAQVNCNRVTCYPFVSSDLYQIHSAILSASGASAAPCTYTTCYPFVSSDLYQIFGALSTLTATGGGTITPGSIWSTTGNSAITYTNFLGSTNNASLLFRTNNTQYLKLDSVGILSLTGKLIVSSTATVSGAITAPFIVSSAGAGIAHVALDANARQLQTAASTTALDFSGTTIAQEATNFSGNVNITGNSLTTGSVAIKQGTLNATGLTVEPYPADPAEYTAIYLNIPAPHTSNNHSMVGDSTGCWLNGVNFSSLRANNELKMTVRSASSQTVLGSTLGSASYLFNKGTITGINTASATNRPSFYHPGDDKQYDGLNPIPLSYDNYFLPGTISMAAANVVTNAFGLFVTPFIQGTNATITNNWGFGTSGNVYIGSKLKISSSGTVLPTAYLELPAGTTAAGTAPQKYNSGPLQTTAEVGAQEFLTDKFYCTITTGAARKEYALFDIAGTSGRVPFETTNGRLTDLAAFTYATNRLSPTYITLAAGAAAAGSAPIVLTSGTNLTTAVAGSFEYNGSALFFTPTGTNRYQAAMVLPGSATLDFPSTTGGTSSDLTITVTGAALNDPVEVGVPNGSMPATTSTSSFFGFVSSANTVTVRFLNTGATFDPPSGTFKVVVNKN